MTPEEAGTRRNRTTASAVLESVWESLAAGTRNRRLIQYVLVGAIGLGVNQGVLYLVTGVAGLSYVIGGAVSRVVSVCTNYVLNDGWTWRAYGASGVARWLWRGVKYVATRVVGIAIGWIALLVLVEMLGLHYLVANVFAVGVGIVWGFGASELWVWRTDESTDADGE